MIMVFIFSWCKIENLQLKGKFYIVYSGERRKSATWRSLFHFHRVMTPHLFAYTRLSGTAVTLCFTAC